MNAEKFVYVGRKSCGCAVFVTVDNPEHKKDTAKSLAECIRDGLTIERMELEQFKRSVDLGCKCESASVPPLRERGGAT